MELNNISGLSNLESVGTDLSIKNNISLRDLCGIKTLLNLGGVAGSILISNKLFNPGEQDIISGNCSI
ncbi:MAG: hypothetical protein U5Q03_12610 [Bacteroidota bacterium]|nr:hypothetical protein [Bacteroidota bacterium]